MYTIYFKLFQVQIWIEMLILSILIGLYVFKLYSLVYYIDCKEYKPKN
jgi:hypothetical protein